MLFGGYLKSHFHDVMLFAGHRITAECRLEIKSNFFLTVSNSKQWHINVGCCFQESRRVLSGNLCSAFSLRSRTSALFQREPGEKKITTKSKSACSDFPQFLMGILRNRNDISIEDCTIGFFNYIKWRCKPQLNVNPCYSDTGNAARLNRKEQCYWC